MTLLPILLGLSVAAAIYYSVWRGYGLGYRKAIKKADYRNREPPHCPTCSCSLEPQGAEHGPKE